MTPIAADDEVWSIDDLELELRKLPGVRAAGFQDLDDVLLVQLHVSDDATRAERGDHGGERADDADVPVSASRIAARHADRPVAVEVVRWRTAPAPGAGSSSPAVAAAPRVPAPAGVGDGRARARLLAVLAFPDTDEVEVHLVLEGRRTIGRAPASRGVEGAAEATVDAIRELGSNLRPRLVWARTIEDTPDRDRIAVAVALEASDEPATMLYGFASGPSPIDAAARATLDALNRRLTRPA